MPFLRSSKTLFMREQKPLNAWCACSGVLGNSCHSLWALLEEADALARMVR